MLISEFARASNLTIDTVRFYVSKGLLAPHVTTKGGSRPYQIFEQEHVEAARTIRLAQSLGFSIKEIASLSDEYRSAQMNPKRGIEILQVQIAKLQEKADQLAAMMDYMRAKIVRLEKQL